jgi:hypothetical protein
LPLLPPRAAAPLALLLLTACPATPPGEDGTDGGAASDAGSGGSDGGGTDGGSAGAACLAGRFLTSLGRDRMLVGVSANPSEDAVVAGGHFTLRYMYISGAHAPGSGPCQSCASSCSANWWGCWQWDQLPPGQYVRDLVEHAKADRPVSVPLITYYTWLQASGRAEGADQLLAATDTAFLTRYFNDWRFLLQQVGQERVLLHVEPDLWGYAQHRSASPSGVAARVRAANPTDCAAQEDSMAGVGRCMVAMVRRYAPNAKVALHASGWGTQVDVLNNKSASFDVAAEARKVADFLLEAGGREADFVVVEASDRDAGYYELRFGREAWWDPTDATLPNYAQAFTWARALSERMDKPHLWWQLPVGQMALPNTSRRWKDNRVATFLTRTAEVARAHGVGVAFGAGEVEQTVPTTDDGHLYQQALALEARGGQAPCPP